MRALSYFFGEAAESLWRSRRAAFLSMLTIAAGLFVLGFFLMVNVNLQRIVGRWTEAAELAVYLKDDATQQQVNAINDVVARGAVASSVRFVSKDEARREFARDFPDLAPAASTLDRNPFPASFEIRLNARAQADPAAVETLATTVGVMPGVADVRYDRRWLGRLNSAVVVLRTIGAVIVLLLAVAAALTVANVVRLTALARRDEIEIMQLVGAPFAYIRGPFIAEGILQGGMGALFAIILLIATFGLIRARWGGLLAGVTGLSGIAFVPTQVLLLLLVGGMALGCVGGFVIARRVR